MKRISLLITLLVMLGMGCVQAQSTLTAMTNTTKKGPILTLGAHTNVLASSGGVFYNGKAMFTYSRTKTAAWVDTIYIGDRDSTKVGYDSTCVVSIVRSNLSWFKPMVPQLFNYPVIGTLANPSKGGSKTNWITLTFPAADTLVGTLKIERPFR